MRGIAKSSRWIYGAAIAMILVLSLPAFAYAAWLDGWDYRRAIDITSPCSEIVTEYQVEINLDASFDYGNALPDGSDIRATLADGITLIPSWVESWDPAGGSATIWVKMPEIPIAGTQIFLYYGNPVTPEPVLAEVGPIGPWDKYPDYIHPVGDLQAGAKLLGENIVYDPVTDHYWMVMAQYRAGGSKVSLMWTDDLNDPNAWNWHGVVVDYANAPHIHYHDGLWYIFYADRTVSSPYPISVDTSSNIGGPYSRAATVLTVTEPWEAFRVDEPYVFQRNDGKWIMMYMGDAGSTTEQVGYAEADDILGPYTKFAGNPCIPFGPPGSIDAGTVADPWVIELDGVYYIGYTVSSTKHSPWRTALVTTTDWINFEKHGVILDWGGPGEWDEYDAFRGAVTRFGDTYYFAYTGSPGGVGNYVTGLATMSAFQEILPDTYTKEDVFIFIDLFDEDLSKWSISHSGSGSSANIAGGVLTMTGIPDSYIQMRGNAEAGIGTLMEVYAQHPDAGLSPGSIEGNTAAEIGYKMPDMGWTDVMRIMDWPDLQKYCIQATDAGNNSGYIPTGVDFDTDWHMYRIYRTDAGTAEFQVDNNLFEGLAAEYIPTVGMYPWLMAYSRNTASQSVFNVDWVRVRNWCGNEAECVLGAAEQPFSDIFGTVTESGMGLLNVEVALLDSDNNPYGITYTDPSGAYLFDDVPAGSYDVVMMVPLGYEPVSSASQEVVLAGADAEVNFEVTEAPDAGKLKNFWEWKRIFYYHRIGGKYSDLADVSIAEIEMYAEALFEHFYDRGDGYAIQMETITFMGDPPRPMTFHELSDLFLAPYENDCIYKINRSLRSVLLNIVSGRLKQNDVVSEDGATASQALTYLVDLYEIGGNENLYIVEVNLQNIHTGRMIASGVIPLDVPNVMYKQGEFGNLPAEFELMQNYPNPFNPVTEISFNLPEAAEVTLDVYNILGQRVTTLVDGFLEAGTHTVEWNASTYSSGIYFSRIRTENYMDTRKMILLK